MREIVSRIVVLSALSLVGGFARGWVARPTARGGLIACAIGAGAVLGAAVGRAIVELCERVEPAPVAIAISIAISSDLTGTSRRLAEKS